MLNPSRIYFAIYPVLNLSDMKKALVIGINSYPDPNKLFGCVNDAGGICGLLTNSLAFTNGDINLLTDGQATKVKILEGLQWLVRGATANDQLLFYFSGHGSQMVLADPVTGQKNIHDVLCPVDIDWTPATCLSDLDFQSVFSALPNGVECIWVADACYSGGLLPFARRSREGRKKAITPPQKIREEISLVMEDHPNAVTKDILGSPLHLALMAACAASEEAQDCYQAVNCNSLFTYFLLQRLNDPGGLQRSLRDLITDITTVISNTPFIQTPQLKGNSTIAQKPFLETMIGS